MIPQQIIDLEVYDATCLNPFGAYAGGGVGRTEQEAREKALANARDREKMAGRSGHVSAPKVTRRKINPRALKGDEFRLLYGERPKDQMAVTPDGVKWVWDSRFGWWSMFQSA